MPRLYTCCTTYQGETITDINPLLIELYKTKTMLVFCARDKQQERILKTPIPPTMKLDVVGWWELKAVGFIDDFGGFNFKKLLAYNAIVILDPKRIDDSFLGPYKVVMDTLKQPVN
jgi:hypothetical protein